VSITDLRSEYMTKTNAPVDDSDAVDPFEPEPGSHHAYPFSGEIEFTLTTEAFGKVSRRRARVEYGCDPDWEYCAPSGVLRAGRGNSLVGIKVLARVDGLHVNQLGEQRQFAYDLQWEACEQFGEGLVDDAVWNEIDRQIEERIQQEDAWRREKFGLPACGYRRFEPSARAWVPDED
jgi:hypothetical protein